MQKTQGKKSGKNQIWIFTTTQSYEKWNL